MFPGWHRHVAGRARALALKTGYGNLLKIASPAL